MWDSNPRRFSLWGLKSHRVTTGAIPLKWEFPPTVSTVEIFRPSILSAHRRIFRVFRAFRPLRVFRVFGAVFTGAKAIRLILLFFLTTGLFNDRGIGLVLFSCDRSNHGLT